MKEVNTDCIYCRVRPGFYCRLLNVHHCEDCFECREEGSVQSPQSVLASVQRQTRKEILEATIKTICQDRQNQYGEPENSFGVISELWSVYLSTKLKTDVTVTSQDVALMMALLKIARHLSGEPKLDNFIDGAGYFAIAGEL